MSFVKLHHKIEVSNSPKKEIKNKLKELSSLIHSDDSKVAKHLIRIIDESYQILCDDNKKIHISEYNILIDKCNNLIKQHNLIIKNNLVEHDELLKKYNDVVDKYNKLLNTKNVGESEDCNNIIDTEEQNNCDKITDDSKYSTIDSLLENVLKDDLMTEDDYEKYFQRMNAEYVRLSNQIIEINNKREKMIPIMNDLQTTHKHNFKKISNEHYTSDEHTKGWIKEMSNEYLQLTEQITEINKKREKIIPVMSDLQAIYRQKYN